MKTIVIAQNKGGSCKTQTATALWTGLNLRGYKSLAIDLDGQCNFTDGAGAEHNPNIIDFMSGTVSDDAIQTVDGMDVIAGTSKLYDVDFTDTKLLRNALQPIQDRYSCCIIDTPPAIDTFTRSALTAADSVIIPVTPDINSLRGLSRLANVIDDIRKRDNADIIIEGLLLTRYKSNTSLSRDMIQTLQDVAYNLNTTLFDVYVRDCVKVAEAPARGENLMKNYPHSTAAEDYNKLIDLLLQ